MTLTRYTAHNADDEAITVQNTARGVMFEIETPGYCEGEQNVSMSHIEYDRGNMEYLTTSCAKAARWLKNYMARQIVDNRDLILLETEAYVYMLRVREHGETFDIIQKGDYDDGLEARWSIFDDTSSGDGFLFDDTADAMKFMYETADACLAYRGLLRIPKERAA